MRPNPIRIVLAENAAAVRDAIVAALKADPEIDLVGVAKTGTEAIELTRRLRPQLVVMGVRIKAVDSFTATKEIMIDVPTPILLVTGAREPRDVDTSVLALRAGALTVAHAPASRPSCDGAERDNFLRIVKAMAQVKVVRRWRARTALAAPPPLMNGTPARIVAIAASTGGPAALQRILSELPPDFPLPILIVQHIANGFMDGVVNWLNTVCSLKVKVPRHGEPILPHTVYLAGDDSHLGLADRSTLMLAGDDPIRGYRPSANFLFESVARAYGSSVLAVIATGMGDDGVEGLRAIRKSGGRVIAQDESSSVVFGMPRAAIEADLADQVLALKDIAPALLAAARKR